MKKVIKKRTLDTIATDCYVLVQKNLHARSWEAYKKTAWPYVRACAQCRMHTQTRTNRRALGQAVHAT